MNVDFDVNNYNEVYMEIIGFNRNGLPDKIKPYSNVHRHIGGEI